MAAPSDGICNVVPGERRKRLTQKRDDRRFSHKSTHTGERGIIQRRGDILTMESSRPVSNKLSQNPKI